MSAPTPAPGDDRPREGYYPDPSIPGYVRYWNGSAWVPGTSRPAPTDGEPLAPPPGVRPAQPASVEETGPHFFDEDPQPDPAAEPQEPASAWTADRARQSGFGTDQDRRVSWGTPGAAADPRVPTAPTPAPGPGPAQPAVPAQTAGPAQSPVPGQASGAAPANVPGQGPGAGQSFGPAQASGAARSPVPAQGPGTSQGPVPGQSFGPAQASGDAAGRPAAGDAESSPGTVVFRRPTAADAPDGDQDAGTMLFRPVPSQGQGEGRGPAGQGTPGAGAAPAWPEAGADFAAQGPVHAGGAGPAAASGPGFAAGKAAADRAASAQGPAAATPGTPAATPRPAAPQPNPAAPGVPQQAAAAPQPRTAASAPANPVSNPLSTPVTSGPGGGQASWAQQVHQLAGAGEAEQPVAPWKPPVEDIFQAAARRQASARPAGLGRRLAARLVDTLVVGAVTSAAAVPLGLKTVDHVSEKIDAAKLTGRTVTVWIVDGTTSVYLGVILAVLLLAGVLCEALPTAKWGRTLGKKLFGLEVRDIEAHEPPSFGAALRRWLVYSVPGLLGIGVVGVVWGLFDRPWRQCWHDKAAHTFVAG
ncbi:RDD family protein [Streptomyces griseosporeus]|uniref:RDD family protein n=1 Tax=Streptomyces griseosporeus TaxID=1910 RepID=UPI003701EE34